MNFEQIYYGGGWNQARSRDYLDVLNPADETRVFRIPRCHDEDVDLALQSAWEAKKKWRETELVHRIHMLREALSYLEDKKEELALSISKEMGSPRQLAKRVHVEGPLEDYANFLSLAKITDFVEEHPGYRLYREPFGVVSCMTPWNYPLHQILLKVIPALLCGNTVLLKPSSEAPGAAFYLADAFHQAKLPPGVFNMITGKGQEVGEILSKDKRIAMVSFTGSTAVGKEILQYGAETVKKIALELGGKSPALLLESGDPELAVKKVMNSCFYNTGQTCSAFTRFFVPSHREEEVLRLIKKRLPSYKVGDPEEKTTRLGPLVSKSRQKKVYDYVMDGISEGAVLALGELPNLEEKGCYFSPCVFTGVKSTMRIAKEEIFGPVLCILPYESLEDALEQCNDTDYGLSGSVFGEEQQALDAAEKLETGNVHVNGSSFVFQAPFGGYKQSGLGRESGLYGLLEFTEVKAVFLGDNIL